MCKPLKELSEVKLYGIDLKMTNGDLAKFIKNAEKLQEFEYHALYREQTICNTIDVAAFEKLVKIVDQRSEKTKLNLLLDRRAFTADLPEEIIRAAPNLLLENW